MLTYPLIRTKTVMQQSGAAAAAAAAAAKSERYNDHGDRMTNGASSDETSAAEQNGHATNGHGANAQRRAATGDSSMVHVLLNILRTEGSRAYTAAALRRSSPRSARVASSSRQKKR